MNTVPFRLSPRSLLSIGLAAGIAAFAALPMVGQTTGDPTNPFPGSGSVLQLTWGANDGAACTQVGGPLDNGETSNSFKGSTCIAAKLDYYSNGWAQLSIWNRAGAELGSNSTATLKGFGLFWCEGSGDFACPTGGDPLVGGPPPITYNDNINDAAHGNWYPGGGGTPGVTNDPVDWRIINPLGQIMVPPNSPNYPITDVMANGFCCTKGDGFYDAGVAITSASTPFTAFNTDVNGDTYADGAYIFQFFLGTGADYNFANQWLVLDAAFSNVADLRPGHEGEFVTQDDFSCVDDRYFGTATADDRSGGGTNVGCGDLAGSLIEVVPEPATLLLLSTGLIGLAPLARRRRRED